MQLGNWAVLYTFKLKQILFPGLEDCDHGFDDGFPKETDLVGDTHSMYVILLSCSCVNLH